MHQLVLVLHVVEVHARTETGRGVGVAQFVVVEFLGRGVRVVAGEHVAVREVAARRLLLRHGEREVELVAVGERVAQARTGIEEVVLLVHVDGLHAVLRGDVVVVHAPRLVADVAVLQVGEEPQPLGRQPRRPGEKVGILLPHVVVVPAASDLLLLHAAHPVQRTPMGAGVVAPRTAEGEVELPRCVAGRGVHASEVVAHDLLADQVGLLDFGVEIDVFRQFRVVLVLLVVAVAVGVEGRGVERPTVVEAVVQDELVVDLQIVVRLVVVIADVRSVGQYVRAGRGLVLAAVVVAAAVALHVLHRDAVVGEVGFGLAAEREEFDHRPSVVVAALEQIGFQIRGAAVDVTVRADVRQPCVDGPVAAQQPRRNADGLLVGVVRSVAERGFARKFGRERSGGHVDRAAESARAVGREACAALHLHRSYGRDQVGRVVPVHRVRVGIVHRHAVDRDVEARGVRAAQADRRAADADTRFVGGDHRGGERQHGRNIRAVAVAGDRVVRKIGVGHRRAGRGARGGDFDLLEAVHAYRIALLRVGGHCGDARQNG